MTVPSMSPGTASSDLGVAEPGADVRTVTTLQGLQGEGSRVAARTSAGPRCRACRATEQTCAYNYGQCCSSCSHWNGYDACGNPIIRQPAPQPVTVLHGSEDGYRRHQTRREAPCRACRAAHLRWKRWL